MKSSGRLNPVVLSMIHAFISTCFVNSWLDKSPQKSELFDSKTLVLSAACNAPTVLTEISQITNKPMNSFDTNFCLKLKLLTSFETLIRETSQLCDDVRQENVILLESDLESEH